MECVYKSGCWQQNKKVLRVQQHFCPNDLTYSNNHQQQKNERKVSRKKLKGKMNELKLKKEKEEKPNGKDESV